MATVPEITPIAPHTIKTIAVLTDFSKNAETALRFAATFARRYQAAIVLAHAYLSPSSAFAAPEVKLIYETLDHYRQKLRLSLLNQTEASYLRDLNCRIVLHEGTPRELLGSLRDADLLVVGTSGETGLSKAALGSTAEGIFRSSPIPVLTIGPNCHCSGSEKLTLRTILYATDFSNGACAALPYVVSMLCKDQDARLVLLHVAHGRDTDPLEELHRLAAEHIPVQPEPAYVVGFGVPDKVIIEEARHYAADLIVVGARGAGAFASAMSHGSGGTAYKVAANAECPVLTIHKDRGAN